MFDVPKIVHVVVPACDMGCFLYASEAVSDRMCHWRPPAQINNATVAVARRSIQSAREMGIHIPHA